MPKSTDDVNQVFMPNKTRTRKGTKFDIHYVFNQTWLNNVRSLLFQANNKKIQIEHKDPISVKAELEALLIKTFNTVCLPRPPPLTHNVSTSQPGKKEEKQLTKWSQPRTNPLTHQMAKLKKEFALYENRQKKKGLEIKYTLSEYLNLHMRQKKKSKLISETLFYSDSRFSITFNAPYFSMDVKDLVLGLRHLFLTTKPEEKPVLYYALSQVSFDVPVHVEQALRFVFSNCGFNSIPQWLGGRMNNNRMKEDWLNLAKKQMIKNKTTTVTQVSKLEDRFGYDTKRYHHKSETSFYKKFVEKNKLNKRKLDHTVPLFNKFSVKHIIEKRDLRFYLLERLSGRMPKGLPKTKILKFEEKWILYINDPTKMFDDSNYQRIREWNKTYVHMKEASIKDFSGEMKVLPKVSTQFQELPEVNAQVEDGPQFWKYLITVAGTLAGVGAITWVVAKKLIAKAYEQIAIFQNKVADKAAGITEQAKAIAIDMIYAGLSIVLFMRSDTTNKMIIASMIAMYFCKGNVSGFVNKMISIVGKYTSINFDINLERRDGPVAQAKDEKLVSDINVFSALYSLVMDSIGMGVPVEVVKYSAQKVKNFSTLISGTLGLEKMIKMLIKVITHVKETLEYIFWKRGNQSFTADIEQWQLSSAPYYGMSNMDVNMSLKDAGTIVSLYNSGKNLLSRITKSNANSIYINSFQAMLNKLEPSHVRALSTLNTSKPRRQPLCIGLYGDAGAGKSKIMDVLIKMMHQHDRTLDPKIPPFDELNLVYTKTPGEEYYDSYQFEKFMIYDDPFIVDDKTKSAEVVKELIGMVNVTHYDLRCADMTMKGTKPFKSEVVFVTFNSDGNLGIKDEKAYQRRFTVRLRAKILSKPDKSLVLDPNCTRWELMNIFDEKVIAEFSTPEMIEYVMKVYKNYDSIVSDDGKDILRAIEEGKNVFEMKKFAAIEEEDEDVEFEKLLSESTSFVVAQAGEDDVDNDVDYPNHVVQRRAIEELRERLRHDRRARDLDLIAEAFLRHMEDDPQNQSDLMGVQYENYNEIVGGNTPDHDWISRFKNLYLKANISGDYAGRRFKLIYDDGVLVAETERLIVENRSVYWQICKITKFSDGVEVKSIYPSYYLIKTFKILDKIANKIADFFDTDVMKSVIFGIKCGLLAMLTLQGFSFVYNSMYGVFNQGPYSGQNKQKQERHAKRVAHSVRVRPKVRANAKTQDVDSQLSESAVSFLSSKRNKKMFVKLHFDTGKAKMHVHGILLMNQKILTVRHGLALILKAPEIVVELLGTEGKESFVYKTEDVGFVESNEHDMLLLNFPGTQLCCRPIIDMFLTESHLHSSNFPDRLDEVYLTNGNFVSHKLVNAYSSVNRHVNGSNGVQYHYVLEGTTYSGKNGDCGKPLFYSSGSNIVIAGFRIAGGRNLAVYCPLFKEDIIKMVNADIEVDAQGFPGDINAIETQIIPRETRITESAIHNVVQKATKKPCHLFPFEKDGTTISPLKNALSKIVNNDKVLDEEILTLIEQVFLYKLPSFGEKFTKVTLNEAINGIPGDDRYQSINLSTSPGYPLKSIFKGRKKKHFFEGEENKLEMTPSMKIDYDNYASGKHSVIFVDTLKDEIRDIERVEDGKTRLFSVSPLAFVLHGRVHLMNFQAFMLDNYLTTGIPVGLNVHSKDWSLLFKKLNNYDHFLNGDFSNYDQTIPLDICLTAKRIIVEIHEDQEIEKIMDDIIYRWHWVLDRAYAKIGGNPSGQPFTTMYNSICNQLLIYYCYAKGYKEINGKLPSICNFNDIYPVVYGDDNLIGVKDNKWFDMILLERLLDEIGMKYTTPDKSDIDQDKPYYTLRETSFLKRTFHNVDGKITAPRPLTEVLETLNWVSTELPWREATTQNAQSVVDDLVHHGRDVYDFYIKRINDALNRAKCDKVLHKYDEIWFNM